MYKTTPVMGPWLSVAEAAKSLGMDVDEFCSFVSDHASDIPHRYADDPQGQHDASKELMISPIAMVCMFLLSNNFEKAQDMVSDMHFFHYEHLPAARASMSNHPCHARIFQ